MSSRLVAVSTRRRWTVVSTDDGRSRVTRDVKCQRAIDVAAGTTIPAAGAEPVDVSSRQAHHASSSLDRERTGDGCLRRRLHLVIRLLMIACWSSSLCHCACAAAAGCTYVQRRVSRRDVCTGTRREAVLQSYSDRPGRDERDCDPPRDSRARCHLRADRASRPVEDPFEFCDIPPEDVEDAASRRAWWRRRLQTIPLPPSELQVQPANGRTLVNFETNFFTDTAPFDRTVTLLGQQVDLHIVPSGFGWRFGDGDELATADRRERRTRTCGSPTTTSARAGSGRRSTRRTPRRTGSTAARGPRCPAVSPSLARRWASRC